MPRDDLYIPTNPDCRVLEVIPESAAPMQVGAPLLSLLLVLPLSLSPPPVPPPPPLLLLLLLLLLLGCCRNPHQLPLAAASAPCFDPRRVPPSAPSWRPSAASSLTTWAPTKR